MIAARATFPWPPSGLSPNGSQGNFHGKARLASAYKARCWLLLREKGKAIRPLPEGAAVARVIVTYCPPPRVSRYDFDNMGKRMKQAFDALAEAIGVDDAEWPVMVLQRGERCKAGAVIVEVEVAG
ncbi:hypothetical protein GL279_00350 [Paracoccus limosus]|uniref:Uncharacterized protein n=1 Tax=Paracoccus limosus TaxID=913252 RepID=A0A844H3V9_9RHOB|nr:hypothetical protein [Paracoccus limosus]MTH33048.1 hypothetical protein [Paracoccus limosus]